MLAESGDDANHEATFEIINPHQDSNVHAPESTPPATSAPTPNIPPPSALPTFASLSGPAFTPTPPPSVPASPPLTKPSGATTSANPFSIRSAPSQQHAPTSGSGIPPLPPKAPEVPNVMIPSTMPTFGEPAPTPAFTSGPQQAGSGIEIPFDMYHGSAMTAASDGGASTEQQTGNAGMWGWFRGAVHSSPLLSKVAETAKSSMNSVIATLDPQMKDYMNNQGLLDVVITLDRDDEIRGVREGVTRVFPASNIRPFVVAAGLHTAAQSVGFANALQAAQQKITYIRNSGYIDQTSVIVGSEGFIIECLPETWLYHDCLVLDDAMRQIQVHAFTQPVQVPNEIVQILKEQTPADYQFKDLGYAVSVSHAMTYLWSLGPTEWQERLTGITRMELLRNAASALAYSYRGKL